MVKDEPSNLSAEVAQQYRSIGEQTSKIEEHGTMCMIADGMSGLKNDRLAVELAILLFRQLYMLV